MANFQLGSSLPEDDEDDEVGTKERRQSLRKKRHYKKDSRFLLDLYTLTFDENEDVDELATCTARLAGEEDDLNGFCFSAPSSPTSIRSRASSALTKVAMPKLSSPISLNLVSLPSAAVGKANSSMQRKSIPCLETNLHKILARKFLDSEEVSFRKAKLLTKAYYQLLRTTNNADIEASKEIQYGDTFQSLSYTIPTATTVSIGQKRSNQHHSQLVQGTSTSSKRIVLADDRLSWPALLRADNKELGRMVAGLNNTVKALNDYLMELLQERDVLHSQQDEMLEHISELTDSLL